LVLLTTTVNGFDMRVMSIYL